MTYNTDSNNNFVVALSAAIQQEVPEGLIAFENYSLTDSSWHDIVANAVEKALDRTNRPDLAGLRMDAENVHLREMLVGILQANASSAVRGNDHLQGVAAIAEELLAERPDWSYMLDRVKGQWELEEDIEARHYKPSDDLQAELAKALNPKRHGILTFTRPSPAPAERPAWLVDAISKVVESGEATAEQIDEYLATNKFYALYDDGDGEVN